MMMRKISIITFVTTSVTMGAPFLLTRANAFTNEPWAAASYGHSEESTV